MTLKDVSGVRKDAMLQLGTPQYYVMDVPAN